MSELRTTLPPGEWFFLPNLGLDTTAESLSAWFEERGMWLPPTHIAVKSYSHCTSALICIPKDTILTLLFWVIDGQLFNGAPVMPELSKRSGGRSQ